LDLIISSILTVTVSPSGVTAKKDFDSTDRLGRGKQTIEDSQY